jgi:starch-binding outer membrane protein, SusD/RagB family
MKTIIYKPLIVISFILMFLSCQDNAFLNQAPYSFTSPENNYKTENDFKMALAGCYETLNTSQITGGMWVPDGTYARGLFYMLQGCSDEVVATNSAISCDFVKASYLPSNVNLLYLWQSYFVGISRCNYLLDKIENVSLLPELKTQIIGETRFMRAFYYYHLSSLFGAVPLNTSSTPEIKAPRASLESVYGLILDDLNFAYQNLATSAIYKSGASKWTAGAYLGMVYNYLASSKRYNVGVSLLTQNPLNSFDWVNADVYSTQSVVVLSDVVNNGPYVLLPKEQYSYLFRESTKATQYQECLFLSEWSDQYSDRFASITEQLTPTGSSTYGGSWGRMIPTFDLYTSYFEGDIRRDQSITGRYETTSVKETIENIGYWVPRNAIPLTSQLQWCTGKFRLAVPGTYSNHTINDCSLNYPLMRLADVKLQLAEALYFTGNETEARAILREIRQRVVDTAKTTLDDLNLAYNRTDFVEELLDERRRELCFESKRRIDLIRFDKTTQVIEGMPLEGNSLVKSGLTTLKDNWSYYKIWLPIPQTELDLNASLIQNAGY